MTALDGIPCERDRLFVPKGSLASGTAARVFYPRSSAEASAVLGELAREPEPPPITFTGSERSFDAHFLPARRAKNPVVLSTRELQAEPVPLGIDERNAEPVLRVRVAAGTTLGALLDAVNREAPAWMPFTSPTSELISVGGSLVANCHSRTSDTYGGYFADHVRSFQLVGVDGKVYACSPEAKTERERELFRMVPGSFGALGMVTELELELRSASPFRTVTASVVRSAKNAVEDVVRSYLELAADNKRERFRWDEGIGLMLFGHPKRGMTTLVSGQSSPEETRVPRTDIPLFELRPRRNALLQGVSNRLPGWTAWLAGRTFREGRTFRTNLRTWSFFQSSYDDATRLLAQRGALWSGVRTLAQIDPRLHMVHQTWVVPRHALLELLALHGELASLPEFRGVVGATEMQDAIPVPPTDWPLQPARANRDGSQLFSVSMSAHERRGLSKNLLIDYCARLSEEGSRRIEGLRVHLLKQLHCDDALLRRMYAPELAALRRVKAELDPAGRVSSRVLERLLA